MGIDRMSTAARIDELRLKFDENPRRYFAPLANEHRKAGDLTQAIALCREHLPKQPGHMSGHIVFGQALYENGDLLEAQGVFEAALLLDPENLIALRHLGDIARARGDASLARRWYERVLEADPRNDDIAALLNSLAERLTPRSATPISTPSLPDHAQSASDDPFSAPDSPDWHTPSFLTSSAVSAASTTASAQAPAARQEDLLDLELSADGDGSVLDVASDVVSDVVQAHESTADAGLDVGVLDVGEPVDDGLDVGGPDVRGRADDDPNDAEVPDFLGGFVAIGESLSDHSFVVEELAEHSSDAASRSEAEEAADPLAEALGAFASHDPAHDPAHEVGEDRSRDIIDAAGPDEAFAGTDGNRLDVSTAPSALHDDADAFEAGLVAQEWPEAERVNARTATPARALTPLSIPTVGITPLSSPALDAAFGALIPERTAAQWDHDALGSGGVNAADDDVKSEPDSARDRGHDVESEADVEAELAADVEADREADVEAELEAELETAFDAPLEMTVDAEYELDSDTTIDDEASVEGDVQASVEAHVVAEFETEFEEAVEAEGEAEIFPDESSAAEAAVEADGESDVEAVVDVEPASELEVADDRISDDSHAVSASEDVDAMDATESDTANDEALEAEESEFELLNSGALLDEDPPLSAAEMPWLSMDEEEREAVEAAASENVDESDAALTPADSAPEEVEPSEQSPAFVTETMAELLVAQGFVDRAMGVYAELVRRRPFDEVLSSRLKELQEMVAEQTAPAEPMVEEEDDAEAAEAAEAAAAALAMRHQPTPLYGTTPIRSATPIHSGTPVRSATPLSTPLYAPPARRTAREAFSALARVQVARRTPPYGERVIDAPTPADGLASLFGAMPVPQDDVAARSLARAFGTHGEMVPGPSLFESAPDEPVADRAASHQQVAPATSNTAFSFDRFFPDPATASASSPSETSSSAAGASSAPKEGGLSSADPASAGADLAQFAHWLKGISKS